MDLNMVVAKTETGKEQLATRRDLAPALRQALILVDGRSTLEALLKKWAGLAHLADSLAQLERLGMIARAAPTMAAPSSPAMPPAFDGRQLKQQLMVLATGMLGAQAAKIVKKIEEATDTKEALAAAIDSCGKVIRLLIDEQKADVFVVSAKDMISRAG